MNFSTQSIFSVVVGRENIPKLVWEKNRKKRMAQDTRDFQKRTKWNDIRIWKKEPTRQELSVILSARPVVLSKVKVISKWIFVCFAWYLKVERTYGWNMCENNDHHILDMTDGRPSGSIILLWKNIRLTTQIKHLIAANIKIFFSNFP